MMTERHQSRNIYKMSFLPEGYKVPKNMSGGMYMKLEDGANKFRVLTDAITGYEFWTNENKPVRVREYPKSVPANIRSDSKIKHFWAFAVYNYAAEAVQVLELTQATIQNAINDLYVIAEWGDPKGYDIVVTRKGEGLDTEYTVSPIPHKELSEAARKEFESKQINLDALFDGGNPFEDSDTSEIEDMIEDSAKMPPRPKSLR